MRLIDADLLKDWLNRREYCDSCTEIDCISCIEDTIDKIPTVNTVKKGYWHHVFEPKENFNDEYWRCSVCNFSTDVPYHRYFFCPGCGSVMSLWKEKSD